MRASWGRGPGELIAEVALAIEMGADDEDISLTIHAHPTLSEDDRPGGGDICGHHYGSATDEEEAQCP